MFVLSTKTSTADRVIAALLAVALVLWGFGAHVKAEAASLIDVSDLLSDSAPGVVSNHEINFEIPTGSADIDADDEIRVTFPAGFDFTTNSVVEADVDLELNAVDEDISGPDYTYGRVGQVVTFTAVGGTASDGDVFTVKVGTNATGGTNQVVNNAATGSYSVLVEIYDEGATLQDSAETVIAIVDTVTVTADVDATFDFFVSGLGSGVDVNGETTTGTSSTTTVPFGTLAAGTPSVIGQELSVVTNAVGGYTVTVETDQQLTSSNLADIDSFANGTDVTTASTTLWESPAGSIGVENEYGHWGMTSEDATLSGGDTYLSQYYAAVRTVPQEVMYHTTVADGIQPNDGLTQVAYKAEVMSFQEAADDYTATLTYIATPTF